MLKKNLLFPMLVAFLALSFNAYAGKIPGNSQADNVLKKDIIKYLNQALPMVSCNQKITEKDVVNTKVVMVQGDNWAEEWTVRACNKTHKFTIALTPDGKGGTNITVLG